MWSNGVVRGEAISSYNGRQEQASYTGDIKAQDDCWARLTETDTKGVDYNYNAVLLSGGRGYIYLQNDATDLTLGLLNGLALISSDQPAKKIAPARRRTAAPDGPAASLSDLGPAQQHTAAIACAHCG